MTKSEHMCAKKMANLKKFLIMLILSIMINMLLVQHVVGASIAQTSGPESMISIADLSEHQETISNGSTSTESTSTHKPTTSIPGDSRTGAQGLIPAANETATIKRPYPTDMHKQGQIIIR